MDETLLIIDVSSLEETKRRMKEAFNDGAADVAPRYFFQTHEQLLETLTPGRWAIIKALTGAGPLGVRELARRVDRDVKAVHTDAQMLARCGLIDKDSDGKLEFPFRAVRVNLHFESCAA
jgi:predicted transcriptional regulator